MRGDALAPTTCTIARRLEGSAHPEDLVGELSPRLLGRHTQADTERVKVRNVYTTAAVWRKLHHVECEEGPVGSHSGRARGCGVSSSGERGRRVEPPDPPQCLSIYLHSHRVFIPGYSFFAFPSYIHSLHYSIPF